MFFKKKKLNNKSKNLLNIKKRIKKINKATSMFIKKINESD